MSDSLFLLLFMVPGTFFLGLYDVYTRKILREGIQEGFLLGIILSAGGILFLLWSIASGLPPLTSDFWYAFGITASLNGVSQLVWFKAFRREEASLISPIRLLTPPLVLFTGFLFLGERPSFMGIIGVLTAVVGLWFLLSQEAVFSKERLKKVLFRPGVLFALSGAVLFALSFPFDKKAVLASSPIFFASMMSLAVGITNFIFHLIIRKEISISWNLLRRISLRDAFFLFFYHTVGSFLVIYALKFSLAAYASSVKRLWSFWAVLFSGGILKEKNIARKLVAVSLMLVGIFLSTFFG